MTATQAPAKVDYGVTAKVAKAIIEELGKPEGFKRVDVKPLYDGQSLRFRANVLVADGYFSRIQDSFFVQTNVAGEIIATQPELTRKYQ
jgi:hypothetical protein